MASHTASDAPSSWFKLRSRKPSKDMAVAADAARRSKPSFSIQARSTSKTTFVSLPSATTSVASDDSLTADEVQPTKRREPVRPSLQEKRLTPSRVAAMPLPAHLIAKDHIPPYSALFTRESFKRVLDNPVGVHKFGRFMARELAAEQLCFWLNAEQLATDFARLQSLSRRIHDLHVPSNATLALNLTASERQDLGVQCQAFAHTEDPFAVARVGAFESMYSDHWPRFIKHRLALAQNISLSQQAKQNVIMSFCLVNANEGQEILMASMGFSQLTGVPLSKRFLQGPATSEASVRRIKEACEQGLPAQELMLNYKQMGTERVPVWILLRIEPLRDAEGHLRYYLGHQFCLNANDSDVAFLLSDDLDNAAPQHEDSGMVRDQYRHATEAALGHHINLENGKRRNSGITPLPMSSVVVDRDQRLKDASALAFDATACRPMSSAGRTPASTNSSSPKVATPTIRVRTPVKRPTSAGRFDQAFALSQRSTQKNGTPFEGIEEEAEMQTQILRKFLIAEPTSGRIMFSSPSLPVAFEQGANFFDIVSASNPSSVMKKLGKAFRDPEAVEATVNLALEAEAQPAACTLNISTLMSGTGEISAVVILVAAASGQ